MKIPFLDMFKLPEDRRIEIICQQIEAGERVGVLVDEEGLDGMEKANRYILKIRSMCNKGIMVKITKGPVPKVITLNIRKES